MENLKEYSFLLKVWPHHHHYNQFSLKKKFGSINLEKNYIEVVLFPQ